MMQATTKRGVYQKLTETDLAAQRAREEADMRLPYEDPKYTYLQYGSLEPRLIDRRKDDSEMVGPDFQSSAIPRVTSRDLEMAGKKGGEGDATAYAMAMEVQKEQWSSAGQRRRRAVRVFEELDIGHAVRIPGGVLMGPQLHRGAVLPRKGADTEEIGLVRPGGRPESDTTHGRIKELVDAVASKDAKDDSDSSDDEAIEMSRTDAIEDVLMRTAGEDTTWSRAGLIDSPVAATQLRVTLDRSKPAPLGWGRSAAHADAYVTITAPFTSKVHAKGLDGEEDDGGDDGGSREERGTGTEDGERKSESKEEGRRKVVGKRKLPVVKKIGVRYGSGIDLRSEAVMRHLARKEVEAESAHRQLKLLEERGLPTQTTRSKLDRESRERHHRKPQSRLEDPKPPIHRWSTTVRNSEELATLVAELHEEFIMEEAIRNGRRAMAEAGSEEDHARLQADVKRKETILHSKRKERAPKREAVDPEILEWATAESRKGSVKKEVRGALGEPLPDEAYRFGEAQWFAGTRTTMLRPYGSPDVSPMYRGDRRSSPPPAVAFGSSVGLTSNASPMLTAGRRRARERLGPLHRTRPLMELGPRVRKATTMEELQELEQVRGLGEPERELALGETGTSSGIRPHALRGFGGVEYVENPMSRRGIGRFQTQLKRNAGVLSPAGVSASFASSSEDGKLPDGVRGFSRGSAKRRHAELRAFAERDCVMEEESDKDTHVSALPDTLERVVESRLTHRDVPLSTPPTGTRTAAAIAHLSGRARASRTAERDTWEGYASQSLSAKPEAARFGKLRAGIEYCFPVVVRNGGPIPQRIRIASLSFDESMEANPKATKGLVSLRVRHRALVVPGGGPVDFLILLWAKHAIEIKATCVVVSERGAPLRIPIHATFLGSASFDAEVERVTGIARQRVHDAVTSGRSIDLARPSQRLWATGHEGEHSLASPGSRYVMTLDEAGDDTQEFRQRKKRHGAEGEEEEDEEDEDDEEEVVDVDVVEETDDETESSTGGNRAVLHKMTDAIDTRSGKEKRSEKRDEKSREALVETHRMSPISDALDEPFSPPSLLETGRVGSAMGGSRARSPIGSDSGGLLDRSVASPASSRRTSSRSGRRRRGSAFEQELEVAMDRVNAAPLRPRKVILPQSTHTAIFTSGDEPDEAPVLPPVTSPVRASAARVSPGMTSTTQSGGRGGQFFADPLTSLSMEATGQLPGSEHHTYNPAIVRSREGRKKAVPQPILEELDFVEGNAADDVGFFPGYVIPQGGTHIRVVPIVPASTGVPVDFVPRILNRKDTDVRAGKDFHHRPLYITSTGKIWDRKRVSPSSKSSPSKVPSPPPKRSDTAATTSSIRSGAIAAAVVIDPEGEFKRELRSRGVDPETFDTKSKRELLNRSMRARIASHRDTDRVKEPEPRTAISIARMTTRF